MPRGDQALHRTALQAVPERRHLDEGSIRVEALTRDWQPIPGFSRTAGA